jgi:hypothetical protein
MLPAVPIAGNDYATLSGYDKFLEHNELELAMDELFGLGVTNHPAAEFWRHLKRAAENMGLSERAGEFDDLAKAHEV